MILPAKGTITTKFIKVVHEALDIANVRGTIIKAPEDGTVTFVGEMGMSKFNPTHAGRVVEITADSRVHRLCHLDNFLAGLHVGQKVKQGQTVATMGNTGFTIPAGEGGVHLHWVLFDNGNRVNPELYLKEDDMVTPRMVNFIHLKMLGREAPADQIKKWAGKVTPDQLVDHYKKTKKYKDHVKVLNQEVLGHFPKEMK